MPLKKHRLDGLPPFEVNSMLKEDFVALLLSVGYSLSSTMPSGKHNRLKFVFIHKRHRSVMAVFDPEIHMIVTAYPINLN